MITILYVCIHNSGRSQMAEAITNARAVQWGHPIHAESAGTIAGSAINPLASDVLAEIGVSLEGHLPKQLTGDMISRADRIITMGCGVDAEACPARFIVTDDWGLDDPKGQPISKVREIRDEIVRRVEYLIADIAAT